MTLTIAYEGGACFDRAEFLLNGSLSTGMIEVVDNIAFEICAPDASIAALINEVGELDLPAGLTSSLEGSLSNALNILSDENDNNNGAALHLLQAFIHQVEAQAGKKIPQENADGLIAVAEQIIGLLTG